MDHLRRVRGRGVRRHAVRAPSLAAIGAAASTPVSFRAARAGRLIPRWRRAMRREDDGRSSPRLRAVLEARWRARLEEGTELSLAYHTAAADLLAGVQEPR